MWVALQALAIVATVCDNRPSRYRISLTVFCTLEQLMTTHWADIDLLSVSSLEAPVFKREWFTFSQFVIWSDLLKQYLSPFTNCHQKETITLLYYYITSYPPRSSPDRFHTKTHRLKEYPSFTPLHRAILT